MAVCRPLPTYSFLTIIGPRLPVINSSYSILCFFKDLLPEFSEIIYFEHEMPVCPECGANMVDNGSRKVKPNKIEGIRKKNNMCVQIVRKVK